MEKINFDSVKYYATIFVITILIMGLFGYTYNFNSEKGFEDNISVEIIQPLKPKAETITVVTDIDKSSDIIDEDELYTKKDKAVKFSPTEKEVRNQIKPFEIILEEGYAKVVVKSDANYSRIVLDVILTQLLTIEESYPQNINIK